ncbi:hypothetical protein ACHQM5_007565 [Ranunculus cassubicifolius]
MEEIKQDEILKKDTPKLVALLGEMKEGLEIVRSKVQALTAKVKENNFSTADGFSYLEAKHLLLISYCQSIVYYLLRKAKGHSIEGHPVVRSLVEIKLFLEKVRPIDKKLDYQIQKLLKIASNTGAKAENDEHKSKAGQNTDDLLKLRPNPDLLIPKQTDTQGGDAVYKPPFLAPIEMGDDDKISKLEKQRIRKEQQNQRQMNQSSYMKELIDHHEGRPEEVREIVGADSRELTRYMAKREARERAEEENFIRAPLTKAEKNKEKHLKRSRNGLIGLTDGFEDLKNLGFQENDDRPEFSSSRGRGKKFSKRRR